MKFFNPFVKVDKPIDWPINKRETIIENVYKLTERFYNDTCPETKTRLIEFLRIKDLNKQLDIGIIRFTDYESYLLSLLYLNYRGINFTLGIDFIYSIIYLSAQQLSFITKMQINDQISIDNCYKNLTPQLKLFFITSFYFRYENNRSFCDELLLGVDNCFTANIDANTIQFSFVNILYDLSYRAELNIFREFNFTRDDMLKLSEKLKYVFKKTKSVPIQRPLAGVLYITLSNWILRSRNNYDVKPICKYISKRNALLAIRNKEFWIKEIDELNDKREGKVFNEIFSKRNWLTFEWSKKFKLTYSRKTYSTSFSKSINDEKMKAEYGNVVLGFKDDSIMQSITNIRVHDNDKYMFSQTLSYDVIYSLDDFKNEINFLCKIIDIICLTSEIKIEFLENIIDYWKFTIKDKKWEYEKEHRFQILIYDEYDYILSRMNGKTFCIKTPLLSYPDFVFCEDKNTREIYEQNICEKEGFTINDYYFRCEKCLNSMYDDYFNSECPICGSKDIKKVDL